MKKNTNIQFLRAVAALLVVVYHTAGHYFVIGGPSSGNIFSFIRQFGYAGVDIFFVISGFVMWVSTKDVSGFAGIIDFVYKRLTRIYLGYWPYFLLLLLILSLTRSGLNDIDLLESFFLTQPAPNKMLLKVSWSLCYELYFYFCFALLLLLPRYRMIYGLLSAAIIISAVQLWGIFSLKIYLMSNFISADMIYLFFCSPYCLEFIGGCFIGIYFEHKRIKSVASLFVIALLLFFLVLYYQENFINGALVQGYYVPQRVILFGAFSLLIVAGCVELGKRGVNIVPRFSLLTGDASYSLYLSHSIILLLFYLSGARTVLKEWNAFQGILMMILVFLIIGYSIFHYQFIEKPLLDVSRKIKIWLSI